MEHSEAVKQMAVEGYLLNELTPELREAFEEHVFDCPECALELRVGAAFVDEAKAQLPDLASSTGTISSHARPKFEWKKPRWFFWDRPAFAVPAFAVLLLVLGYQNLATIPALQQAATEPRILPWASAQSIHAGTRGASHTPVEADRKQGAVLLIELPQDLAYTSYAFDLYNPQDKRSWTKTVTAPSRESGGGGTFSLLIPGSGLQQGAYTLGISGITSQGGRTEIDRRVFDIHFDE